MANSSTEPIYVDDLDSMLSYTGVWFTSTSSYNFQNSSHGTNTAGSSVRFEFKGSQISVYGSVDPSSQSACIRPPISTYVLDNMPMATFFAPTTESQLNNSLFYESPALVDGHHTLVITSASQNSLFWFDYIKYTPSGMC
ncbi:hypothetical protein BJ138DRAFT_1018371 [Hygrophoropsis aurantiaca]|uniref:Uncharacterized protein n=1 Tax=Hygrophoropsis aurantiaca TaxID=72124 RepID=A0ACB7ZW12_9AGAM|nr:hypothetical protein BJ138DRAFT_1018371 [Hygrophoropsis aurantiaca]